MRRIRRGTVCLLRLFPSTMQAILTVHPVLSSTSSQVQVRSFSLSTSSRGRLLFLLCSRKSCRLRLQLITRRKSSPDRKQPILHHRSACLIHFEQYHVVSPSSASTARIESIIQIACPQADLDCELVTITCVLWAASRRASSNARLPLPG